MDNGIFFSKAGTRTGRVHNAQNLRNHVKCVHEGIKLFKFDSCDKIFSLSPILKNHIKTVHKFVNFGCDSCNKTFSSIKTHQKSVHDKIRFKRSKDSTSFKKPQKIEYNFSKMPPCKLNN